MDPLQKHVEEMRDLYAAEIQAARESGEIPSPMLLESWARYDVAARSEDPGRAFARNWPHQVAPSLPPLARRRR